MTWKLAIAGTIERCRANPRPYWPKLFLTRTISRHTVMTVLIRESAKGLNEEMKIVTALSPMLRAARTQMVATHVLLGVPELSNL